MTAAFDPPSPSSAGIPAVWRERSPLMTDMGYRLFNHIRQHPDAPVWNHEVGDRLQPIDLPHVEAYREAVFEGRRPASNFPGPDILEWVARMRSRVALFSDHLPEGFDLERDWGYIPTMSREDLATRIERLVPRDADLSRLIVYDTSGTTGHALVLPYHPRAVALNHPLMEFVLDRYGVHPPFGPDRVVCINVCAQVNTYVFANVFSVWNQSGFAKVNLHPKDWRGSRESARRFFADLHPHFITADPVTLAEMMRWDIPIRPAAIVSTALTLSDGLSAAVQRHFGCPVIDWYSTTETGPIAYASPAKDGFHVIPTDIYVEIVDGQGYPVELGEFGEIAVTGSRNPYLPLLRYRTGDYARLALESSPSGDPLPRLVDLNGREVVFYRAMDGSVVNPVDISRIMRLTCPFVQHRFLQRADGSCHLAIRPAHNVPLDVEGLQRGLRSLFGNDQPLRIEVDEELGLELPGGKVVSFETELSIDAEDSTSE